MKQFSPILLIDTPCEEKREENFSSLKIFPPACSCVVSLNSFFFFGVRRGQQKRSKKPKARSREMKKSWKWVRGDKNRKLKTSEHTHLNTFISFSLFLKIRNISRTLQSRKVLWTKGKATRETERENVNRTEIKSSSNYHEESLVYIDDRHQSPPKTLSCVCLIIKEFECFDNEASRRRARMRSSAFFFRIWN